MSKRKSVNKTRSIRKRMIVLFGSLLLIAFFVVLLFSRIALQLFLTNELKDDFEEEINIISSVFKEEFADARESNEAGKLLESLRSGKRRVGYFELDSQIEIISYNNGKIRQITENKNFSEVEEELINNTIANGNYNKILTLNRNIDNEEVNYRVYISPLVQATNIENKLYAVMYVSVQEQVVILQKFTRILFLILLVVYLIAIFGVFIIASRLTKPIKKMKLFASSLGSGEEPAEISIKTSDELSDLALALNTMAKDIKTANEEQLRFLQNASHELKTPLTSIQGYAEGLIDGVINNQDEALEIIVDESKRLKKIVNQLSLLSKLETGVKTFKSETVDLLACVEDVVNRINVQAGKEINIVIRCDRKQTYTVIGDYDGYLQSYMNVLSNGLRYAHKEIEIILVNKGTHIEVQFIDDGLGIKEIAIPHLFERFYKGVKGDTGLGLAIVKAITEQQKASVEVYNSEDKGAVFKFLYPIN